MPTSNKTPALSLNNWLGTDKPMRSDFTEDNLILDSVIGGHLQDAVSHLSAADREKFDSPYLLESYAGTGDADQHFTLPFTPKFVFVFYQTRAFSEYVAEGDYTKCNAGFAAPGLSTAAVSLQGNRLTVKQTTGEAAGKLFYNLNLRDGQYFYLAVK